MAEVRGAFQKTEATTLLPLRTCSISSVSGFLKFAIPICLFAATPSRGESQFSQVAGQNTILDPLSGKIDLVDAD
jgi:hypothetical protein